MTYLQDIEQNNNLTSGLLTVNDIQSFAQLPLSLPSMIIGGGSFLNSSASMIPELNKSHYFPELEEKLISANKFIDRKLPFFKPLIQNIEAFEAPLVGTIFASKLYDTYKKNKDLFSNRRYALPIGQYQGYDPSIIQEYNDLRLTTMQGLRGKLRLGNTEQINTLSARSLASYNQFAGALSNVNTVLKLGPERIKEYGKSIRELTEKDLKNSVKSVEALAAAYEAASAGFTKAKDNQAVMVAGLKLAKAGAADSGEVMRMLTQTMNTYGASAKEASTYAAKFNNIVEKGITTVSELSNTLGETAVVAKSAGVNIDEIGAAIATMTTKGMGTAEANTALQGVLMTVIDKTPISAKTIRDLNRGITNEEDKIKLDSYTISNDPDGKGLIKELQKINRVTKGNATLAADVFSSIQAYKGYTTLMNDKGKTLSDNFDSMKATVSTKLDEVFGIRIDNQNEKFNKIFNRIEESYIKMGEKVEPFFDKSITSLETFVDKITTTSEKWSDVLPGILKLKTAVENFVGALTNITKAIVGGLLLYNMARMGGLLQSVMSSFSYVKNGKDAQNRGLGARLTKASLEVVGINQLRGKMIDTRPVDEYGTMSGVLTASQSAIYNRFRISQARDYLTTWMPEAIRKPVEQIGKIGSKILHSTGIFGERFNPEKRPDIFRDKDGELLRVNPNLIDSSTGITRTHNVRPELLNEREINQKIKDIENTEIAKKAKAIQDANTLLNIVNEDKDRKLTEKAQRNLLNPNDPTYIQTQQEVTRLQNEIATKKSKVTDYENRISRLQNHSVKTQIEEDLLINKQKREQFKQNNSSIIDIEKKLDNIKDKIKKEQNKSNPDQTAINNLKTEKTELKNQLNNAIANVNPNYKTDKKEHKKLKQEKQSLETQLNNINQNISSRTNKIQNRIDQENQNINDLEQEKTAKEKSITPHTQGIANRVYVYDKEGGMIEDKNNQKYIDIENERNKYIKNFQDINQKLKETKTAIKNIDTELTNQSLPQANKNELQKQKNDLENEKNKLQEQKKQTVSELKRTKQEIKTIIKESPTIEATPYATVLASEEDTENAKRRQLAQDNLQKELKKIEQDKAIAKGEIPENIKPIYTGIGKIEYKEIDADTITTKYAEEVQQSKEYREKTEKIEQQLYGKQKDRNILSSANVTIKEKKEAKKRLEEQIAHAKKRQASANPLDILRSNFLGMAGKDFGEIEQGRLSNNSTYVNEQSISQFQQKYAKNQQGQIVPINPNAPLPSGYTALTSAESSAQLLPQYEKGFQQYRKRLLEKGLTEEQANEKVARQRAKLIDSNTLKQWVAQENARTGGNMSVAEGRQYLQNTGQRLQVDNQGNIVAIGQGTYNATTFAGKAGRGLRNAISSSGIGSMIAMGAIFTGISKVSEAVYDITPWGSYGQANQNYDLMEQNLTKGLNKTDEETLDKRLQELIISKEIFDNRAINHNKDITIGTKKIAKEKLIKEYYTKRDQLYKAKGNKEKDIIQNEVSDIVNKINSFDINESTILNNISYKRNSATELNKEINISEEAVAGISEKILETKKEIENLNNKDSKALRSKLSDLETQKQKEQELLQIKKDYLSLLKGEEISQEGIAKSLEAKFADTQADSYNAKLGKGQLRSIGSVSGNGFSNLITTGGLGLAGALGAFILAGGLTIGTGGAGIVPLALAMAGGGAGLTTAQGLSDFQTEGKMSIYDLDKYAQEFGILDEKGRGVRPKGFFEEGADNTADFLKSIVGDNSGAFEDFFNKGIVTLNKGTKSTNKLSELYKNQTYGQLTGYKKNPDYQTPKPLTSEEEIYLENNKNKNFNIKDGLFGLAKGAITGGLKGALFGGLSGGAIGSVGGPVSMIPLAMAGTIFGGIGGAIIGGISGSYQGFNKVNVLKEKKRNYEKNKDIPEFIIDENTSTTINNLDIFNKKISQMSDKDIKTIRQSVEDYNLESKGDLNTGLAKQIAIDKENLAIAENEYEKLLKNPNSNSSRLKVAKENLDYQKSIADKNEKILIDKQKYEEASLNKIDEIEAFHVQYKRNKMGLFYLGEAQIEENTDSLKELSDIEKRIETSARDFTKPITKADIAALSVKEKITFKEAENKLVKQKNEAMGLLSQEYNSKISNVLESGQTLYDSGQWTAKDYINQINSLLDNDNFKYLDTNLRTNLASQKIQLTEEKGQEKAASYNLSNQILEQKYINGDITQFEFDVQSANNQEKAIKEIIKAKREALEVSRETGKLNRERETEALKEIKLLKLQSSELKQKANQIEALNKISKKEVNLAIKNIALSDNLTLKGFNAETENEFKQNLIDQIGIDKDNIKLKENDYKKQVKKTGKNSLEAKKILLELNNLKSASFNNVVDASNDINNFYSNESNRFLRNNEIIDNYESFGYEGDINTQKENINKSEKADKKGLIEKYNLLIEANKRKNIKGLTLYQKELKIEDEKILKNKKLNNRFGLINKTINKNNIGLDKLSQEQEIYENYNQMGFDTNPEISIQLVDQTLNKAEQNITDKYKLIKDANKILNIKGLTKEQQENKTLEEKQLRMRKRASIFTKADLKIQNTTSEINYGSQELEILLSEYEKGSLFLNEKIEKSITDLITNKRKEVEDRFKFIENEFKSKGFEVPKKIKREAEINKKKAEQEASILRDQLIIFKNKPVIDKIDLKLKKSELETNIAEQKTNLENQKLELISQESEINNRLTLTEGLPDYLSENINRINQNKYIQSEKKIYSNQSQILQNKLNQLNDPNNLELLNIDKQELEKKQELELENTTKKRKEEIILELKALKESKEVIKSSNEIQKKGLTLEQKNLNIKISQIEAQERINKLTEKSQSELSTLKANKELKINKLDTLSSKKGIIDSTIDAVQNTFGDSGESRKMVVKLLEAKEKSLEKQYDLKMKIYEVEQKSFILEQESVKINLQEKEKQLQKDLEKAKKEGNQEEIKDIEKAIQQNQWAQNEHQKLIDNSKSILIEEKEILKDEKTLEEIGLIGQIQGIRYKPENQKKLGNKIRNLTDKVSSDSYINQETEDYSAFTDNNQPEIFINEKRILPKNIIPQLPLNFTKNKDNNIYIDIDKTLEKLNSNLSNFEKINNSLLDETLKNNINSNKIENNKTETSNTYNQSFEIKIEVKNTSDNKIGKDIAKSIESNIGNLLNQAKLYKEQGK